MSDASRLRSLYYLGQMRLDLGEHSRALQPLLRSYELAVSSADPHWTGLTSRALSDLYGDMNYRAETLEIATIERDAFRLKGDTIFMLYDIYAIPGTAIEAITTDEAPAEYYTLQGVRISAESLTPGMYIKRQGAKVERISQSYES